MRRIRAIPLPLLHIDLAIYRCDAACETRKAFISFTQRTHLAILTRTGCVFLTAVCLRKGNPSRDNRGTTWLFFEAHKSPRSSPLSPLDLPSCSL